MKRFHGILLIIGLMLAASVSASADSYKLVYKSKAGEAVKYSISADIDMSQQMMGQDVQTTMKSLMLVSMLTESVGEDGSISYAVKPESMKLSIKSMQMDSTFSDPEGIVGVRSRLVVASNGKTLKQEAIDSVAKSQINQLGSQFTTMNLPRLPVVAMEVGKPYPIESVDTAKRMGGEMITKSHSTLTIKSVEHKDGRTILVIPFTTKMNITGSGSMMNMSLAIDGEGSGTGTFYFDPEAGVIETLDSSTDVQMTIATTGDQKMVIPSNQSMKVTMKLVK